MNGIDTEILFGYYNRIGKRNYKANQMETSIVSNLNRDELFIKLDATVKKLKLIDARFKKKGADFDHYNASKIMRDTQLTMIWLIKTEHPRVFAAWKKARANGAKPIKPVHHINANVRVVQCGQRKVIEIMPKTRIYWTLLVKENGTWTPQFGDYDRNVVRDERFDSYADDDCMMIGTSPEQSAIDLYVYNLNNGIENE